MESIDAAFRRRVREGLPPVLAADPEVVSDDLLRGLFASQLVSRHADLAARALQARGTGFYTIGSAGHEGNAAVASALRLTDPAFLHYRSGGFYAERARVHGGVDAMEDILSGVVAARTDPISGGRHKVFGRAELSIVPQTSTIASHLPRALGVAMSLRHAVKLGQEAQWPADAVAAASLGDASINHSTAVGALNAAAQAAFRGVPVPLLVVCEDNGIGISTPTPVGWVAQTWSNRTGIRYFAADGTDVVDALVAARAAAEWAREKRRPAFLHLSTVRFMSHAGADVETAYRSAAAIAADQERDPLVRTAAHLIARGILSPEGVLAAYESAAEHATAVAERVETLPHLDDPEEIARPLRRTQPRAVARHARTAASPERRTEVFGTLPEQEGPLTLAASINRALGDVLAADPGAIVFGEDVGRKGGVYGVTRGLQRRLGAARVFDTILDEQTILGLALGAGLSGLLPLPEIQYLAYLHNAEDQLRGEAASQAFFSNGRYTNPMVVRVAGYGYQKGFGGHFHNDNSVAVLRDIPGVVIASPGTPADAVRMLRSCVGAARVDGAVCVFLEPIARYHTRELLDGDQTGYMEPYPAPDGPDAHIALGEGAVYGDGEDLTIATWANGLYLSRRAAARLAAEGIAVRIVDLRWLAPMPHDLVAEHAAATGRLLVVDETRHSGGVGEAVVAGAVAAGFRGDVARIASHDTFTPLGPAAAHVLVSEDDIVAAARSLVRG